MHVIDEYVALRALAGDWPAELPHDLLGLTYARHWRLLSALVAPKEGGRISSKVGALSDESRQAIRRPHPDLLEVLDPRPTSLLAASLLEAIGPTSMLIAETLAAAIHHDSAIFFGDPRNAHGAMAEHAEALGVEVIVVRSPA